MRLTSVLYLKTLRPSPENPHNLSPHTPTASAFSRQERKLEQLFRFLKHGLIHKRYSPHLVALLILNETRRGRRVYIFQCLETPLICKAVYVII